MPGQFKHLCKAYAERKDVDEVVFLTKPKPDLAIDGIRKVEYLSPREPARSTHRYLQHTERGILQGQECWRACQKLKEEGFIPDVIVGHCGWGDGVFLKDSFPDTPLLSFFEFYYHSHGADVGFDGEEGGVTPDDEGRIRVKNLLNLMNLEACDWGLSPTRWQQMLHPPAFQPKISIIHDGVDVDTLRPDPAAAVKLADGTQLSKKDEVVTYVARNFEPYRGLPTFLKAARLILERRPKTHIIAVGADGVSYGRKLESGTYRHIWLEKTGLMDHPERHRLHFAGYLPYEQHVRILQLSSAHLYLTYPFVLSWSMIEAMACGALVIGSTTPPVQEVIAHEQNGLLVDFFSPEEIADTVDRIFADKDRMQPLRDAARRTAEERYTLKKLLPLQMALIDDLAARKMPPPAAARIAKEHSDFIPPIAWNGHGQKIC